MATRRNINSDIQIPVSFNFSFASNNKRLKAALSKSAAVNRGYMLSNKAPLVHVWVIGNMLFTLKAWPMASV